MERAGDTIELMQGIALWGYWRDTAQNWVGRDVHAMLDAYTTTVGAEVDLGCQRLFVLTRGDRPDAEEFQVFVGGECLRPELDEAWIANGLFAQMTIRPRLGHAWTPAVREAMEEFHSEWLPGSGYRYRGFDFVVDSSESRGKSPTLQMYFAIEPEA